MPTIGSSLPSVRSSPTSSVGGPPRDVTDDDGAPPSAAAGPSDDFAAAASAPKVSLDVPPGIANVTTPAKVDPNGFEPKHVDVPWLSQDPESDEYDAKANGNCNATCRDMMEARVTDAKGGVIPGGKRDMLPTAPVSGHTLATTGDGRLKPDAALASKAKRYIDGQLEGGQPVMVGVNRCAGARNDDGVTDHFVVITGRGVDDQGRLYYSFNDPAARGAANGSDQNPNNRFFVDEQTGLLYRPGADGNQSKIDGRANPNYRQRYEVSQVRVNTLVAPTLDLSQKT